MQLGAIDLDAVIAAHEEGDDVSRDQLAALGAAKAGLHGVAGERFDLDDLAAPGLRGHCDYGARHQMSPSSRQADSVTITFTLPDQKEPSLICATASTVPLSAMRARVVRTARPARGPRWTLATFGCGFFSVKTWIAFT